MNIISKPAIKVNLSHGRPVNGMFIAIPSILKEKILDVSPDNNRIQAVLLKMNNQVFLIINTYFPTNTRNNNAAEVETTLEAIDSVLKNNNFHKVFFTGDINCDFNRNSVHVNFVREFLEENSFTKSWERFQVDFTHTHEANGITSVSKLDNFFLSQNLDDDISL